ncbi:uncharacterized protein BCR38DRAFT_507817, partial [Pseudomassariella vexata]
PSFNLRILVPPKLFATHGTNCGCQAQQPYSRHHLRRGPRFCIATDAVGLEGLVIGVDVSCGMLAEAHGRQKWEPVLGSRIKFAKHDVTSPDMPEELTGLDMRGGFDVVICSNAFVLFDEPAEVLRHWRGWLKGCDRMLIEITRSRHGDRTCIGSDEFAVASNRRWVKGKKPFRDYCKTKAWSSKKRKKIIKNSSHGQAYWHASHVL